MGEQALPPRPLTVGELLDAALALLRANAVALLSSALLLAVAEAALLYPLRRAGLSHADTYLPVPFGRFDAYWLAVTAGLGTEAAAIAVLGGLAARAAVPALVGADRVPRPVPAHLFARHARVWPLAALALLAGIVAWALAWAGMVGWLVWYPLVGLAGPALAVDRRVLAGTARLRPLGPLRATGRSMRLVVAGALRPGAIRLLGYLAWLPIRIGLGLGGALALGLLIPGRVAALLVTYAVWVLVNTVVYPVLGCLDAVLHLENRMRVEGLDITLSRALPLGVPVERVLAVPS